MPRSIPRGLVPFVPVIAIVVELLAFAVTPWLALGLAVVLVGTVVWLRYQDVKGVDYGTLRRNDPWTRAWTAFWRARKERDE